MTAGTILGPAPAVDSSSYALVAASFNSTGNKKETFSSRKRMFLPHYIELLNRLSVVPLFPRSIFRPLCASVYINVFTLYITTESNVKMNYFEWKRQPTA